MKLLAHIFVAAFALCAILFGGGIVFIIIASMFGAMVSFIHAAIVCMFSLFCGVIFFLIIVRLILHSWPKSWRSKHLH